MKRSIAERLHRSLASHRKANPKAKGDPVDLRPLVRARDRVTVSTAPRTIHDFGGFPRELYQVQYLAPGDPDLARHVPQMLAPLPVNLDNSWDLDRGPWSVLRHVYPAADIPVVQLSIDETP